jgi:hypothetical protein
MLFIVWYLKKSLGVAILSFVFLVSIVGRHRSRRSAWATFLRARIRLAQRGELPWALMDFLDDAHRRGVLRQIGAVYQFRHGRLQDHLAHQDGSPTRGLLPEG